MKFFSIALASALLTAGAADAASQLAEIRFTTSDFADLDAACTTGPYSLCSGSISAYVPDYVYKAFDPFDASLGKLTEVRTSIFIDIEGVLILRGDGVRAPKGEFETEIRVVTNAGDFFQTRTEKMTLQDGIGTDSVRKDYSFSYTETESTMFPTFLRAVEQEFDTENPLKGGLRFLPSAAVLQDGSCLAIPFVAPTPCGATNRITGIGSTYDYGTYIDRNIPFARMQVEYIYTPFPEEPVEPETPIDPVPLPASGLLLMGGLAALGWRRRGRAGSACTG